MSAQLLTQIGAAATHFRLGEISMASEVMIAVVDGIQAYLTADGDPDNARAFMPALEMIVDAQQRGDFLLVADLLDYEVGPLVNATIGAQGPKSA